MVLLLLLVLESACALTVTYDSYTVGGYQLNQSCSPAKSLGGLGTCATAELCAGKQSSLPTCTWSTAPRNATEEVNKLACRSCIQSPNPICASSYLSRVVNNKGGIKAFYCNDRFLVMHTSAAGSHQGNLMDVPNPPGGTFPNGSACKTRTQNEGYMRGRFPIQYSLLNTSTKDNNIADGFRGGGDFDGGYMNGTSGVYYGMPTRGNIGFTVAGQEIFPIFNNRAEYTLESCEVDSCNEHTGMGGGWSHLHGDPFGDGKNCLYSAADYQGTEVHPPLIGFSRDGPLIYGRYLFQSSEGFNVTIDDCGGHEHGIIGYHYHAMLFTSKSKQNIQYPNYSPGPFQCFKGNILQTFTSLDMYWNNTIMENGKNLDLPCCGMTEYYAAPGVFNVNWGTRPVTTTKPSSNPTAIPSVQGATLAPSQIPTSKPTTAPSTTPSTAPSTTGATAHPSSQPTASPGVSAPYTPGTTGNSTALSGALSHDLGSCMFLTFVFVGVVQWRPLP